MNEIDGKNILKTLLQDVEPREEAEAKPASSVPDTEEEIIELGESFDFDGFQVVRREFFAHLRDPSVTFNNCKFSVNSACLQKFPDTTSVQILINRETKVMALIPCPDGAKDSFQWCNISKGKRKPKAVTCRLFFAKVADMMGWNPNYKYKLLGKLVHANGQFLLAFDLTATEIYQRVETPGAKPKNSRVPVFPSEWQNQFGLPYSEHQQSMQINIFDGYAVYSIKDTVPDNKPDEEGSTQISIPDTPLQSHGSELR
jgi:hypothetical protein